MYDAALVVSSIYEGDPRGLPGEGLGLQYPLTFYSILFYGMTVSM